MGQPGKSAYRETLTDKVERAHERLMMGAVPDVLEVIGLSRRNTKHPA
jgi:hypothetical protein